MENICILAQFYGVKNEVLMHLVVPLSLPTKWGTESSTMPRSRAQLLAFFVNTNVT